MSKKTKTNKKGDTNVKKKSGKFATMRDELDLSHAEIKKAGRGGWNDFEINSYEGYRTSNRNKRVTKNVQERIRASHVGRMVLRLGPSLKLAA